MSQNIVVATAYATLGTDAVVHAVNEGDLGIFPGSVDFSCVEPRIITPSNGEISHF